MKKAFFLKLVLTLLLGVALATGTLSPALATQTTTVFADDFGSGAGSINDVTTWDVVGYTDWSADSDGSGASTRIIDSLFNYGTNRYLELSGSLSGGQSVTKSNISTVGLTNIHLEFTWGYTNNNLGGDGSLVVEWKLSSDAGWTTVNTYIGSHDDSALPNANLVDFALGVTAANTSIDIRFTGNSTLGVDKLRVDNVIVSGDPLTSADISIGKTATAQVLSGGTVTYTLTVKNDGPDTASNVVVKETYPAGFTFVSATTAPDANPPDNTTWTFANLLVGTTVITINGTLTGNVGDVLTNNVAVTTGTSDPDSDDHADSATTTIIAPLPSADISIVKAATAQVLSGGTVTYTLTVKNDGPDTASNVVVKETYPAGFTFVSATTAPDANPPDNTTWTFANLLVGTTVITINGTLTGNVGDVLTNNVAVTTGTSDPDSDDHADSATTTIVAPTLSADISIVKAATAQVLSGGTVTYTLTVKNDGPDTASNVVVKETYPAGFTFVSATTAPDANPPDNTTWTFANLLVGTTVITINGTATGNVGDVLTNNVAVTFSTSDPDTDDHTSSASTTIRGLSADISIAKTATASVSSGGAVTYTLTVTNGGPDTATNIVVTETYPAGFTFGSATPAPDANPPGNVWTIASLPIGSTAITINGTLTGNVGDQLQNSVAMVSSIDITPNNNTSSATTAIVLVPTLTPSGDQFNVIGATETFTVNNVPAGYTVTWSIIEISGPATTFTQSGNTATVVKGGQGEVTVTATLTSPNGPTIVLQAEKKWGIITQTAISAPQSIPVVWSDTNLNYTGTAVVNDTVTASYMGNVSVHVAAGAIVKWFLVAGGAAVPMTPGDASIVIPAIDTLPDALYAQFYTGALPNPTLLGTQTTTTTDNNGFCSVNVITHFEEAVKVVAVATYPIPINLDVFPEVTTINFFTVEYEKVPQVAWAGDKVLLEFNTGIPYASVHFMLEQQSVGTLEQLTAGGYVEDVWVTANEKGVAKCLGHSEDPGEFDVLAAVYINVEDTTLIRQVLVNQHAFLVYFLKFEDVTLGNVVGIRDGHNSGLWTPPNPWNPALDVTSATLNVSQDDLLRANVRGWFTNSQFNTARPAREVVNGPTSVTLPAGRWVLPDDWAALAGPNWQSNRVHWDIMDAPNDTEKALNPDGPYNVPASSGGVAINPVIGPFAPGLEVMTPTGWMANVITSTDPLRQVKTVVPNGALDKYDAPMPPAKMLFEILSGPGFFKGANKAQIYYVVESGVTKYTDPFYAEFIPANEFIPNISNGYDWNSFGTPSANPPVPGQGPYPFWNVINRPTLNPTVLSLGPILPDLDSAGNPIPGTGVSNPDWAGHPTKVEVYSDNHGEAMVYLNGYWNMQLGAFKTNGAYDVPKGTAIGTTVARAMADYPYMRKHEAMLSNTVSKTWLWGKQILGTNPAPYPNGTTDPSDTRMVLQTGTLTNLQGTPPNQTAMSDKKMAWVWVTNPDGKKAIGERVDWTVEQASGSGINIPDVTGMGISSYNDITKAIGTEHGFLAGTNGVTLNVERTIGRSWTREPTAPEKLLFAKFWPTLDPNAYAVAAVEITSSLPSLVDLQISIQEGILGTIRRHATLDFSAADPADDPVLLGDANQDGVINMADVIMVERMILGLAPATTEITNRHPGQPPNMGDVIYIERCILGK